MKNNHVYHGIVPAFYACYEDNGQISPERTRHLARYLLEKGVHALYVGGSSGECIYQTVEERKRTLEAVINEVGSEIPVYAHVACNSIEDSCLLAAHAQTWGAAAIFAIPPIYFRLPDGAIADYWNAISEAAPDTDFFIYNIPQLAGTALNIPLLRQMLKNPRVQGIKNSSMAAQDIQMWLDEGAGKLKIFNGPDEQLLSGLATGACGGIGGTYAVMPELYLKIYELFEKNEIARAREIQNEVCRIIYRMCEAKGSLYAVMKEILKHDGVNVGTVRRPLPQLQSGDGKIVLEAETMIQAAMERYCRREL